MIITFQNFIYASEAEQALIWQWRNSDRVRLRMINQDLIELAAHQRWMGGLARRDDCRYFLVRDDEKPIGVLDFTNLNRAEKTAEWGFYLDRGNRPGFGVVGFLALARYFDDWRFTELHSRVLAANAGSYDWHRKLLFSINPGQPAGPADLVDLVLRREAWAGQSGELRERLFSGFPDCRAVWRE